MMVKKIPYGSWKIELEGKDTAVVSTGPLTLKLKEEITKAKKNVSLYNAIYLRPMDEAKIEQLLDYKKIIIYDPYSTKEGFVNALENRLFELGYTGQVIVKAIPTKFIRQATIEEQREEYKLQVKDIIDLL